MRHGFTLIEMLVVMAILAILAGLILAAVGAVREGTRKATSRSIAAITHTGLAQRAAERGALPILPPHPAASEAATRPAFVRAGSLGFTAGSAVTATGLAYRARSVAAVGDATARAALLLDDDLHAEEIAGIPVLPWAFGAPRGWLHSVGDGSGLIAHRTLPDPALGDSLRYATGAVLKTPYDDPRIYPTGDHLHLAGGTAAERRARSKPAVEELLTSTALAELLALGGLRAHEGPALTGADWLNQLSATDAPGDSWIAGACRQGGTWVPAALGGTALVDAWGRDLALTVDAGSGRVVIRSAGPSGVLRWHPGPDGLWQTDAQATLPAGDDRDGSRDNIEEGLP